MDTESSLTVDTGTGGAVGASSEEADLLRHSVKKFKRRINGDMNPVPTFRRCRTHRREILPGNGKGKNLWTRLDRLYKDHPFILVKEKMIWKIGASLIAFAWLRVEIRGVAWRVPG